MHPTNNLHHCFIECLLCAGTVLSMKEREARSILSVLGKIKAQWNEREHLLGNQRRGFGKALKEWHSSTHGNAFYLGTRIQSHKPRSDHGLSLAAQWFITCHPTHSCCSGHLGAVSPFLLSAPGFLWEFPLYEDLLGDRTQFSSQPEKASLRRWHLKDSNWIKNKKSSRQRNSKSEAWGRNELGHSRNPEYSRNIEMSREGNWGHIPASLELIPPKH